jgi:hypothetical protein
MCHILEIAVVKTRAQGNSLPIHRETTTNAFSFSYDFLDGAVLSHVRSKPLNPVGFRHFSISKMPGPADGIFRSS